MVKARISIDSKKLQSDIVKSIADEINSVLTVVAIPIEREFRKLVKDAILSSKEYRSIVDGELKHELGIPDGDVRLNVIIKVLLQYIVITPVKIKRVGNRLKGGLEIRILDGSFDNILSLPEARIFLPDGNELEWLDWLLLKGKARIIKGYDIVLGPGRAGRNIMVKAEAKSWFVPPQFSGHQNNNFITRAIDDISEEFPKIIEKQIEKKL